VGTMDAAVARQRCSKHISTTTNQHAPQELLEEVFSVESVPGLYKVQAGHAKGNVTGKPCSWGI
jgi:hypothetical protein